ncbi:MAG TPA: RloB family protein [Ruminiclostridium sp.]
MGTDDIKKKKMAEKTKNNAYQSRKIGVIPPNPTILIMCEGEKTEPNYFDEFKLSNVSVKLESTKGGDALHVVQQAIKLADEEPYDEVWCVFDRDLHTENPQPERFNEAIYKVENFKTLKEYKISKNFKRVKKFNYAYSNDAFELWYILHFDYMHSAKPRHEYCKMLSMRMGKKYVKNSCDMYDDLIDKQSHAIRRAKTLLDEYANHNPEKDNPSTTVHILVQELNKYLES